MNADTHEAVWLDQHITVTLDEFARLCGLTAAELGELVDEGVVEPEASDPAGALFRADSVTTTARKPPSPRVNLIALIVQ